MTPRERLIADLSNPLNNPPGFSLRKTANEEKREEEERMKKNFNLVPRRKRSLRKPIKDPQDLLDFSKVPRRKRTENTPKSPTISPEHAALKPTNTQEKFLPLKTSVKIVDPKHIIDKTLDLNDVDHHQNNLFMPLESLIRNDFLTPEETRIIEEDYENDGNMGVAAFLMDQRAKNWNVVLRKRFLKRTDSGRFYWSYMLRGEWSDVVQENGLKDGDKISVWSFRYRETLCFSLAPPPSSVVAT